MRNKKIIKVSILGILVNVVLVIFKMIVGFFVNSIAIILDGINNLSDALSSIITIVGTKLSSKKPDKEHPYGHGRIEYLAAIIIAIIVLFAGLTSLKESFEKIINPVTANYTMVSLLIILVAVFTKYFFGQYVKVQGEELNSGSLKASGTDAINDAFISLSTFIAAIMSIVFHISLEGYIGLLISVFILKSAIEILKDTVNDMIGIRADNHLTKKLKENILKHDGVLGVYDLTLHNYGPSNNIATAHIQVNDDTTAKQIHKITRNIAIDIYEKMGILLTLGIYASNNGGEYADIQKYINKLIKKYKTIYQIHGFYVDEDIKNVSFDLIFSFDEENPQIIVEDITKNLKEKFPEYDYSVIIDRDFSD